MTDPAGSLRILTLVFTDLADSTALKTERGDEAVGDLIGRHRVLVNDLAAESGGHIIDWAGDGCFLTFETASAAVAFALRIQQAHFDTPDLPGVRIGLHMGEVSERPGPDGDGGHPRVEGLAVDLAARIAGLASPGQVLMSATVANSARQRIDKRLFDRPVRWQSYGSYMLKGFGEPLEIREAGLEGVAHFVAPAASEKAAPVTQQHNVSRVRRGLPIVIASLLILGAAAGYFVWTGAARTAATVPVASVPQTDSDTAAVPEFGSRPAIAVLPFDNLSPDPEQAFFADGLAEDLITRLSTWRAFPVIARNSSFQYRGGNLDLKRVSAELGARYLVEGSVRRAGDRIRITAQLIDASSGEHVWAETYDRDVTDLFALQDEISATIAASVTNDATRAEGERARQRGTEDLDAWAAYQLGLQSADLYTREGSAEARRYFTQAVELDPRFAAPLAQLANLDLWELYFGWREVSDEQLAAVIANSRRAIELDPRDPVAHISLSGGYALSGNVTQGLESALRALDLNPSMPAVWVTLSWLQLLNEDPESCVASSERVEKLNPHGALAWFTDDNIAGCYWEMGRYHESLEAARRLVSARPNYYWGYLYIALDNVALGRLDEARAAIAEAKRVQPDLSRELIQRLYGVARPEVDARRNAALREAGLE